MIKIYYYINQDNKIVYPPQDDLIDLIPYVEIYADEGKILHNIYTDDFLMSPVRIPVGLEKELEEVSLDKSN